MVGEPVVASHAACKSSAIVPVVSTVQVELVCIEALAEVNAESELGDISKMQFAICVPLTPAVLVVTPQCRRHTPFVMLGRTVTAPVVMRELPPIFRLMVRVRALAGVE